jgi:Protein of unknown function (DUF3606)
MGDVLASKGERDRSDIAMQDKAGVRRWLRHFGVTKNELKSAVEKVGNSVVAVRKQWASIAKRSFFDSVQFLDNLNGYKRCPQPSLLEASVSAN